MKIALCDDEQEIRKELGNLLYNLGHQVDCYNHPLPLLEKEYPLYFLDIGMDEMNGIELGNQLRKRYPNSLIVYLTNFDDYRSQAFGVHAFDYLKKPIEKSDIERVLNDIAKMNQPEEKLCSFHTKDGILQIALQDILYFEFSGRNVILHTLHQCYPMRSSLRTIVDMMKEYDFVMPHKSFYIHLLHVQLLKGYDITMVNGDVIPLSQKRSSKFRDELNDYLYRRMKGEPK